MWLETNPTFCVNICVKFLILNVSAHSVVTDKIALYAVLINAEGNMGMLV